MNATLSIQGSNGLWGDAPSYCRDLDGIYSAAHSRYTNLMNSMFGVLCWDVIQGTSKYQYCDETRHPGMEGAKGDIAPMLPT